MSTKKNILFMSLIGAITFLLLGVIASADGCYQSKFCFRFFDSHLTQTFAIMLLLSIPVFFLSLLTYRMHDEAFHAWWNPARFWIPIIMLATIITSIIDGQSGSSIGDFPISPFILGFLYTVFISSSLWKIIRTNRRLEK